MSSTTNTLAHYEIKFQSATGKHLGEVKRVAVEGGQGQETTAIDYGEGVNQEVLNSGSKVMRARNDTRYCKRIPVAPYYFYDCECGWSTGHKYNQRTVNLLKRLHRKKCQPEESRPKKKKK